VKKIDLYQLNKAEYVAPKNPVVIVCQPAQYLAIKGQGEPGGEAFQAAIGALYKAAFTIKMAKKRAGQDYTVCKLEAAWTAPDQWTLLIRTPEFIKTADLPPGKVKLKTMEEGRVLQVLHVGPYSEIRAAMHRLHEFAAVEKLRPHGPPHEIYLSDPRRVEPARLRTILRLPVK
jgi:hypothetical protein